MGWNHDKEIKLSAFVLTTNSIKNQFPFIESIKSFLDCVDEVVVVDGGSMDGTVEEIKKLEGNIKIVQDEDTKWEDNWSYSRMGHNFDRGLKECSGDWVIKFDADYVIKESHFGDLRKECERGTENNKMALSFTRVNFILSDRYYVKSAKTLGINKKLALKQKMNLHYGFDLKRWGWGFEFINAKFQENGIWFGDMIRYQSNSVVPKCTVFNYDYMFMDEQTARQSRLRHFRAEMNQRNMEYKLAEIKNIKNEVSEDIAWNLYKKQCLDNFRRDQYKITLDNHPKEIQKIIKNLKPEQQGYNCWNWQENKSTYYE